MADIFISYARSDHDRIEPLAAALEAEGFSVWWDREIVGGAAFAEEIERELAAATAVIAAWSAAAVKSDWVRDEASYARERRKLIPIRIEDVEAPLGFRQVQVIDFVDWDGARESEAFARLKNALARRLVDGSAPSPGEAAASAISTPPKTTAKPNKGSDFFNELGRRHVFRVAGLYAAASWLAMQVLAVMGAPLGVPGWVTSAFALALLAGFPIALILAWAFEMTPQGMERTTALAGGGATQKGVSKIDYAILAALVLVGAIVAWQGLRVAPPREAAPSVEPQAEAANKIPAPDTTANAADRVTSEGDFDSIAVLAFADLSPGGDQEYFSDGIAEEILNVLARETDLHVAARTSSFTFKGSGETVGAIAKALNVDTVLEGSVRKANGKLRITAQLIDAGTGFHLWSETYDREVSDIFAIQDEIARAIVGSLPNSQLQTGIAAVTQTNNEAYDLYLQGRHQLARRTRRSIEAAKALFEETIKIDPDYAPAWADLAISALLLRAGPGTYGELTLEEVVAVSAPAVEKALILDPLLAEAHTARALLLGNQGDVTGAIAAYRKAIDLNPSVANARHLLYLALLGQGAFRDAFEVIDRAVELDPLSAITLENHVTSLALRGRLDETLAAAIRLNNLHPDWHHSKTALSRAYGWNGQFAEAAQLIQVASKASGAHNLDIDAAFQLIHIKHFDHAFLKTAPVDPASFLDVVEGRHEEARALVMKNYEDNPENPFALWRAVWTLWAIGDAKAALALAEEFAGQQEGTLSPWALRPGNCYPGLYVAGLRQRLGDKAKAAPILAACRDVLDHAAAQGFVLPFYERDMGAELLVLEGRYDEALTELRRLTDSGKFISWWIRIEPIYEPLRDDPRFQAIVADLDAFADRERTRYLALEGE